MNSIFKVESLCLFTVQGLTLHTKKSMQINPDEIRSLTEPKQKNLINVESVDNLKPLFIQSGIIV